MTSDMIKTSSCVEECGIEHTLNMMGGKWKPFILWQLAKYGTKRYGEIRRYIPSVTNKMLGQQLKELAADCLVTRKDYRTVPPKVEYSITAEGLSLIPILELMCTWGLNHEALCRTKGKSDIGS